AEVGAFSAQHAIARGRDGERRKGRTHRSQILSRHKSRSQAGRTGPYAERGSEKGWTQWSNHGRSAFQWIVLCNRRKRHGSGPNACTMERSTGLHRPALINWATKRAKSLGKRG